MIFEIAVLGTNKHLIKQTVDYFGSLFTLSNGTKLGGSSKNGYYLFTPIQFSKPNPFYSFPLRTVITKENNLIVNHNQDWEHFPCNHHISIEEEDGFYSVDCWKRTSRYVDCYIWCGSKESVPAPLLYFKHIVIAHFEELMKFDQNYMANC